MLAEILDWQTLNYFEFLLDRYLFWGDAGSVPKIERSSLSGGSRTTIISQGIVYPIAITVDMDGSRIYWLDSVRDSIESSNLYGRDRKLLQRLSHKFLYDIVLYRVSMDTRSIPEKQSLLTMCLTGAWETKSHCMFWVFNEVLKWTYYFISCIIYPLITKILSSSFSWSFLWKLPHFVKKFVFIC